MPLAIALLLSALLQPLAAVLAKRGVPPALATAITLLSGVIGIGLLVWLVEEQFRNGLGDLDHAGQRRHRQDPGLADQRARSGCPSSRSTTYVDNARNSLSQNRSRLTSGAIGAAGTVGEVLTGALLTLFATIFFIKDGRQIWTWVVRLFPPAAASGSRARASGPGGR